MLGEALYQELVAAAPQMTAMAAGAAADMMISGGGQALRAVRNLGKGLYKDVGGHHIHAKSAFEGHPNYNPRQGLSISQEFMKEKGWSHRDITAAQRSLFKELYQSGRPNTLKEHNRIAVEALIAGGATVDEARTLVAESVLNLRRQGVRTPTRIPWYTR